MAGKGAETTLGILGSVLDIAGPLLLGPGSESIPFGNPFRAAAESLRSKREKEGLLQTLSQFPETQPLLDLGAAIMGGGQGMASGIMPGEVGGIPVGPTSVPAISGANIPQAPLDPSVPLPTSTGVPSTLDQALKLSTPSSSSPLQDIVKYASQQTGIEPNLIAAIINQESGGKTNAVSPAGAQGLMQLMPETARSLGVTDPNDPVQNVMGGSKYLRQMMDRYGGDITKALAAYNAGPGNVDKYGGVPPFAETQNYVPSVLEKAGRGDLLSSLKMREVSGPKSSKSLLQALSQGGQSPQGSQIGNLPVSFLKTAAENDILDPETFRKILFSQSQQKPSSGSDLLEKLILQDQRRQDRLEQMDIQNQMRQDNMQMFNKLMTERQSTLTEKRQSYLTPAQQEEMGRYDSMLSGLRTLPDSLPEGAFGAAATAKIPGVGGYLATKNYPQIAQLDKQLKSLVASKAFLDGGKNLTGIERDLTFGTAPSLFDAPEFYPQIKKNYESRIRLMQLGAAYSMATTGKKDVSGVVSDEELENYSLFRDALRQDGRKALSDPAMKQLMGDLGIDGLIIDFKKAQ